MLGWGLPQGSAKVPQHCCGTMMLFAAWREEGREGKREQKERLEVN